MPFFSRCRLPYVLLAAATSAIPSLAHGQTQVSAEAMGLLDSIRNSHPSFMVRAEVNKGTRIYRDGDPLVIRAACEVDAYVYVLYQQADDQVLLLYPNSFQPAHRVHARQAIQIPDPQDSFRWRVKSPFGKETVKVIASKEPIEEFSGESRAQARPVTAKQVKGAELELGKTPAADWAEDEVKIETYEESQAPTTPIARRYGVFVGVANYEFNEAYHNLKAGQAMNLWSSHRAARIMSDVLMEVGQLSDRKVLTNEEATRDNIKRAVAGWLPAISHPGDTVIIYMAGHGFQVPTRNLHPAFAPYDTIVGEPMLNEILREIEAKPDAESSGRFRATLARLGPGLKEEVARGQSVDDAIYERTMVTSESFGGWLQGLDGRQIVIILDSCHSGGFVEAGQNPDAGKGLDTMAMSLATPISRLMAIGQKECVLLAACGTEQESTQSYEAGIMTRVLIDLLRKTPGSVDIKTCHECCTAAIAEYCKAHPEKKAYEPRLIGYTDPIYLKP